MATVEESVVVDASLAETWDTYFDPSGWPEWVDGFGSVITAEGYPERGGTLRWRSSPAGRGEVTERVLEHEARRRHKVAFADPGMVGEVDTTFAIVAAGTRVGQRLTYRLVQRGPIAMLAVLFVKAQVRGSVRRSLLGLKESAEQGPR